MQLLSSWKSLNLKGSSLDIHFVMQEFLSMSHHEVQTENTEGTIGVEGLLNF